MENLSDRLIQLSEIIEKRTQEVVTRSPHDHEFESGVCSLEVDLLRTIQYAIFSKELLPLEKVNVSETIYLLESLSSLFKTYGKVDSYVDEYHFVNFIKSLSDFEINATATYNPVRDSEFDVESLPEDSEHFFYDHVLVKAHSGLTIDFKIISFYYMQSNEVDDYLYQWRFKDKDYFSNDIKYVLKFCLTN